MAEHGFRVNPGWVFYAPWEWEPFEKAVEAMFSLKDTPEVVIIPGRRALRFFYRFCGNRGIEIGRDIGVMANDDVDKELRPRVTVTTNDPAVIAADAWKLMEQCLEGKISTRTVQLHVRQGASVRRKTRGR